MTGPQPSDDEPRGDASASDSSPGSGQDRPGLKGAAVQGVRDALNPVANLVDAIGGHAILAGRALSWLFRPPYRPSNYLDAAEYIGFNSMPIVLLVGLFTGMVTSLQSVIAFRTVNFESMAGGTTALALAWELAPVLTALMLAGRAGAGIATELGTMRITEQIDALESMAVDPVQFLVLPRLVIGTLMAPALALMFFIIGMGGAYVVAVVSEGVDHGQFILKIRDLLLPVHIIHGLIKSAVFGFFVMLIGCYQGFHAKGGGRGVGIGTTRAVVAGSVSVLVLDYFVQELLLVVLPVPIR